MVITTMEDVEIGVILGIGEHWQKWKQVGLFEFLLLPKKLLITLKAC